MINTLTPIHAQDIAHIEETCISNPWSKEQITQALQQQDSYAFFGFFENDKLAGYISINFVLDESYICNIAVDSNYRKKGIGQALISHSKNFCEKKGMSFLSLEVRVSNKQAISLYEKSGFVNQGIRKNFYSSPKEDAFIFTKFLMKGEGIC